MAQIDKSTPQASKAVSRTKTNASPGSAVLVSDDGKTTIFPQVVAKIAGIAVREVEGVYKLVPYSTGQQMAALAKSVTRTEMRDLGVHVEVGSKEAAIDVRIITHYGASIPAISEAIRRNVAERIGLMTGLQIAELNIDVVDLYFPEEDEDIEDELQGRVE